MVRAVALIVSFGLVGCAPILGIEDGVELDASTIPDAGELPDVPTVEPTIFVAETGSDANPGSAAAPLRSITEALLRAPVGWTVQVGPGAYEEVSGETFPISINQDVTVLGDEATRGSDRLIVFDGAGPTIELQPGAQLRGMNVQNPNGEGVVGFSGGVVAGSTIGVTVTGILLQGTDHFEITNNVVSSAAFGIDSDAVNLTVTDNELIGNGIGFDTRADVTLTNNTLACSTQADLRASGADVDADGNRWDHVPPSEGNLGGGIDITRANGATVSANNPTLAPNPCP